MKRINKQGYIEIKIGKVWKLEHVFIVESFGKKKLPKGWVVHHRDQRKWNNTLVNLCPFPSQNRHASYHNKLKRYGYETNPMLKELDQNWNKFLNNG